MMVLAFILGACIGSFFNVVLLRLGREGGILTGRSHCPDCHRALQWYELIPVISFLVLRGRCRTCRKRISWRYPLVELTTALVAVLFVLQYGPPTSIESLFFAFLLAALVLLFFFDVFWFVLPDIIIFPTILITVGYHILLKHAFLNALSIGFMVCLLFAILYIVSRGTWVGFGDVKLEFLIGFAFGYPFGVLITIAAVWLATLVGLALLLIQRATVKTALPFGAFVAAVSIIYILFAHEFQIFRWIFA